MIWNINIVEFSRRRICCILDRFTKLVRAIPMDGKSAVDCASVVLVYWVAAYGPLYRLLSDGEPQFTSHCSPLSLR